MTLKLSLLELPEIVPILLTHPVCLLAPQYLCIFVCYSIHFFGSVKLISVLSQLFLMIFYLKLFAQLYNVLSKGQKAKSVRNTLSPTYINIRLLRSCNLFRMKSFANFCFFRILTYDIYYKNSISEPSGLFHFWPL